MLLSLRLMWFQWGLINKIKTLSPQWKNDSFDKRWVVVYLQQRLTGPQSAHGLTVSWLTVVREKINVLFRGENDAVTVYHHSIHVTHYLFTTNTAQRICVTVRLWCEPSCSLQGLLRALQTMQSESFDSISNKFFFLFALLFCKIKVSILLHISRHEC